MSFEIKWSGKDKYGSGKFWGYLIHHARYEEHWYDPYYAFWGSDKSNVVSFKKICDYAMKGDFRKNIKKKQTRYTPSDEMHSKVGTEFEHTMLLRKLKQGN